MAFASATDAALRRWQGQAAFLFAAWKRGGVARTAIAVPITDPVWSKNTAELHFLVAMTLTPRSNRLGVGHFSEGDVKEAARGFRLRAAQ